MVSARDRRRRVILDLEHLQVADYGTFEGVTDEQRQFISKLHAAEPIRPEEMMFLALRSLFQFTWPEPQSEDDIRLLAECLGLCGWPGRRELVEQRCRARVMIARVGRPVPKTVLRSVRKPIRKGQTPPRRAAVVRRAAP
jgi:hypothetical protein